MVEPSLFKTIFEYLDLRSVLRLETTCTLLRDMVIQTRIYRRKHRVICGSLSTGDVLGEDLQIEESLHFKKKLADYFYR